MPKVIFVAADGAQREYAAEAGKSLMKAATAANIPEILAECGGACACATCQVVIDEAWRDKVPPRGPVEASMFDDDDDPNRRLSCQITVTDSHDGLVVHIPKS